MSKPDATGAKSLEEILASIRKSLTGSGEGSDASSGKRGAAPKAEPIDAADGDGLLSARLAGALSEPTNGAVLDEDITELLAPDGKQSASPGPAATAKPNDARSEGKDPLWFLRRPSAEGEGKSNDSQPPAASTQPGEAAPSPASAKVEEVKLSRPEVLRASLPPLFGAETEHSPVPAARTALPPEAAKAAPSVAPAAHPPATPAASNGAGKPAPSSLLTARTQPLHPPAEPVDEMARVVAEAETAPTPEAREPTFFRASAPAPVAEPATVVEAASSPQAASDPPAEVKSVNGLLTETHTDTATEAVPALLQEPPATKPAPTPESPQARSLEQVIGELLEPVIRQWLGSNLPRLVEEVVREEVARAIAAERGAPKV